MKLVAFLQARLGSYSGKAIRKLLEANLCRVDGRVERFGSRVLRGHEKVEVAKGWKEVLEAKPVVIETLFENEAFKIINKPAGWVCQDEQVKKSFGAGHFLVHRLDKDTTGLLILAKSKSSRDALMELFEKREIQKQYVALVDGVVKEESGVRKSFMAKKGNLVWGSAPHGLTAITHWRRLAVGTQATLILCEPITGRTHQIRVHMAEMGHPILVDRTYATQFRSPLFAKRPLLHAYRLQFSFAGERVDVKAPLFVDICEAMRQVGMEMGPLRQFLDE
jgi:RluA family pseudouridine synthase